MESQKLELYPYRVFEEDGKKYVFSGEVGGIFEIDDRICSILAQEGKTHSEACQSLGGIMEREEYESLVDKMERFRFVRTEENDREIRKLRQGGQRESINSLILFVIQSCNLHCTYCFASGGEYQDKGIMSLATAKKAVDFLVENSGTDRPSISFFGGEPLMNMPLLLRLMPYIRETEKKSGKRFLLGITTNGTLLNEKQRAFLVGNNISCMVSMDGCKPVQDANRVFVNGTGSYDLVMAQTREMRKKGQVTCRATVTPASLDVTSSFHHLTEKGFTRVFFDAAKNMMTDQEYEEYNRQFLKLFQELKGMIQTGEYDKARKSSNLMNLLHMVHNAGLRGSACGVGQSVAAVDIHGDIYPCQRFVSEKGFCMGNVYDGWLRNKRMAFLRTAHIGKHTQCAKCWAKNLCMGDCAYENLEQTGSICRTPEKVCRHRKDIFEAVIRLYVGLPEEFKKMLD